IVAAMHFGIFLEERRPGTSEAAAFQETLDLAEAAEASGLDGVWLGEIHFNPARSVSSAPIALASYIAARTRRVRIGTAVQVLPLGNPLRIAEDVATVDHLSRGRFDFGIGRSGSPPPPHPPRRPPPANHARLSGTPHPPPLPALRGA